MPSAICAKSQSKSPNAFFFNLARKAEARLGHFAFDFGPRSPSHTRKCASKIGKKSVRRSIFFADWGKKRSAERFFSQSAPAQGAETGSCGPRRKLPNQHWSRSSNIGAGGLIIGNRFAPGPDENLGLPVHIFHSKIIPVRASTYRKRLPVRAAGRPAPMLP